ncbi:hypothetical protein HQ560_13095 [bacterium]|nr:hypothetical protein [bacterium]
MRRANILIILTALLLPALGLAEGNMVEKEVAKELAMLRESLRKAGPTTWKFRTPYKTVLSETLDPNAMVLDGEEYAVDIALRRTLALLHDIQAMNDAPDLSAEDAALEALRPEIESLHAAIDAGKAKVKAAETALKKQADATYKKAIADNARWLEGKEPFTKRDEGGLTRTAMRMLQDGADAAKIVAAYEKMRQQHDRGRRNRMFLSPRDITPPPLPEELATLAKLAKIRRRIAFANPLVQGIDNILFVKRDAMPDGESQGGHMCDQFFGHNSTHGGSTRDQYGIFVLGDPFSDKPTVRNLIENSVVENGRLKGKKLVGGGYLAPDLSFDGKQALFAYSEGSEQKWQIDSSFHIFKVNVDGTGLTQLTDGATNDFDPCWLPNGRIVFISERRGGFGRCHGRNVPSYTLHSMLDDGDDITILSPHETNEWQPSVGHDGRIVYTRWDYVDRGFNQAHHPWYTYPDGRDARAIHGNTRTNGSSAPFLEGQLRAVPGSYKYTSTAAAHHGESRGSLILIDPMAEDDDGMTPVRRITPLSPCPEKETRFHKRGAYSTAWPLSEDYYLCVHDRNPGWFSEKVRPEDTNYAMYLLDKFGNMELLVRDEKVSVLDPIPLRPRHKPPVIPNGTLVGRGKDEPRPIASQLPKTAVIGLTNVYNSRHPFPEGEKVTHLRIFQVLPKTTPHASNPALGHGSQKGAKYILGTVPVEADGSAMFQAPVDVPLLFHAVGADGTAIQGMRTVTYVKPGETLVCNGCHEKRGTPPSAATSTPLAFLRPPSKIAPGPDGTKPFNYVRLVQPVLDAKCVGCHEKKRKEGKKSPDLTAGDFTKNKRKWFTSYDSLKRYVFYYDSASFTAASTIPGKFGARASKLYPMLKKGHHDLKLTTSEMLRITLWLDNNCIFFGHEDDIVAQAQGKVIFPSLE